MSGQFAILKWRDFQANAAHSFENLRGTDNFCDVTLVSEDQRKVLAHKVVLAGSSQYFHNVLKNTNDSHPLLCLNEVQITELNYMIDYIYKGEVQVPQEQLDSFIKCAQRFQLEGMIQTQEETNKNHNVDEKISCKVKITKNQEAEPLKTEMTETKILAVQSGEFQDIEELEDKLEKMFHRLPDPPGGQIPRRPDLKYVCSLCGQKSRFKGHAKEHAETHLKGQSFPCQNCTKTYKSRNSFRSHLIKNKCIQFSNSKIQKQEVNN